MVGRLVGEVDFSDGFGILLDKRFGGVAEEGWMRDVR
jgi:hypothetical protein